MADIIQIPTAYHEEHLWETFRECHIRYHAGAPVPFKELQRHQDRFMEVYTKRDCGRKDKGRYKI